MAAAMAAVGSPFNLKAYFSSCGTAKGNGATARQIHSWRLKWYKKLRSNILKSGFTGYLPSQICNRAILMLIINKTGAVYGVLQMIRNNVWQ